MEMKHFANKLFEEDGVPDKVKEIARAIEKDHGRDPESAYKIAWSVYNKKKQVSEEISKTIPPAFFEDLIRLHKEVLIDNSGQQWVFLDDELDQADARGVNVTGDDGEEKYISFSSIEPKDLYFPRLDKGNTKYQVVTKDGSKLYDYSQLLDKFQVVGYSRIDGPSRKEIKGQPQLKGLVGPFYNGQDDGKTIVRYETTQVYNELSEGLSGRDYGIGYKNEIIEFFRKNPEPNDKQVHQFALDLGCDPDELEREIYKMFSDLLCQHGYIESTVDIGASKETNNKQLYREKDLVPLSNRINLSHLGIK